MLVKQLLATKHGSFCMVSTVCWWSCILRFWDICKILVFCESWRRHQMETFSTLRAICAGNSPVTGEFPSQRPVMQSFDFFFYLRLNKRLSKQSRGWWFDTLSRPLWCHCNVDHAINFQEKSWNEIFGLNRPLFVGCLPLTSMFRTPKSLHKCLVYIYQWQSMATGSLWNVNSLAPGRSEFDSEYIIYNLVLLIGIFRSSHDDNALRWMPQDLTDDKSTLVQVMAWCHQATSHYLSQCWLSSLLPYGVARPQWVNCNKK